MYSLTCHILIFSEIQLRMYVCQFHNYPPKKKNFNMFAFCCSHTLLHAQKKRTKFEFFIFQVPWLPSTYGPLTMNYRFIQPGTFVAINFPSISLSLSHFWSFLHCLLSNKAIKSPAKNFIFGPRNGQKGFQHFSKG